jgi:hypothetical protein
LAGGGEKRAEEEARDKDGEVTRASEVRRA